MKRILLFIIVIAAMATVVSCSKNFTNKPPQDVLTTGTFYKSPEELLAATAPLYNIVWFEYNDKGSIGIGDARGGNMQTNDYAPYYKFAVPATDVSTLLTAYKSFYKTIAQANTLIRNVNNLATNVTDAQKNMAIAEARFMRGLAYAYLVRNWGPVPIIYDNLAQLSDTAIQRNTIEDIWKFILLDFNYAVKNLPATAVQSGRLTKWSAEGMIAKMYLTRAGVGVSGARRQTDLDSAKFFAQDVVQKSPHVLEEKYADLFTSAKHSGTTNNAESLFSLQWVPSTATWGTNNSFQAYMAKDGTITGSWDGWGAAHGASADLIKYYMAHPEDSLRRKASFMFDGDFFPEIAQKDGGYRYSSTSIANVKKYIIGSPADNGGKGVEMAANINTYMLRLAEVYLIYAEAILGNAASTTDGEALKYFNRVRTRAGLAPMSSITFDDIFQEKRIETAMEGVCWGEYVRLYYFNPAKAMAMIAAEDKGSYTITAIAASNPRKWTVVYTPEYWPATTQTIYLPFPETEMVKTPGLAKPPVPFDFGLLK
jgi:starch-binding outer membrane protein, SusD/RagB family